MKLLSHLKENIDAWGIEDWLWWLVLVPVLAIAALIAFDNGTLPDYLWAIAKAVAWVVFIAIPGLLLIGYLFTKLTKRNKK